MFLAFGGFCRENLGCQIQRLILALPRLFWQFDFWAIGFQDVLNHDDHFSVQSILSTQHKVAEMSIVNGRETLSPKSCIVIT